MEKSVSFKTPKITGEIKDSILVSLEQTSSDQTTTASTAPESFSPLIIVQEKNWKDANLSSDPTHLDVDNNVSSSSSSSSSVDYNNRIGYGNGTSDSSISDHNHKSASGTTDIEDDSYSEEMKKLRTERDDGSKPRDNASRTNSNSTSNNEDDERNKIRREKNKTAAANYRRKRVCLMDNLIEQTDELEEQRRLLQKEIEEYNEQKTELKSILDAHMETCSNKSSLLLQKPKRPASLPLIKEKPQSPQMIPTSHGILISTPSRDLGFESFVDWLHPVELTAGGCDSSDDVEDV